MVTKTLNGLQYIVISPSHYRLKGNIPGIVELDIHYTNNGNKWWVSLIEDRGPRYKKRYRSTITDFFSSLEEAVASFELEEDKKR